MINPKVRTSPRVSDRQTWQSQEKETFLALHALEPFLSNAQTEEAKLIILPAAILQGTAFSGPGRSGMD